MAISGQFSTQNKENETATNYVHDISKSLNGTEFYGLSESETIPFPIPTNWCWCRLSDIGTTNIGLTYHPEDVVSDGVPVMRSSNIVNNRMDYSDLLSVNCEIRDKQYLNKGDILICARNGSKALVGKCAIYDGEIGETAFGAFMAAFRSECNEYLYLFFQTKAFRRYFENDNNKQINQVTQKILKDAIVPIPPLEEQKRIVKRVNAVFEVLDTIDELQSAYSSDLEVLKSKIIDAGIQGKLTEQLPEDGNAEDLYAAIQEEKNKLIKEKKIKKSKALPEITEDEIPFEIPDNWKWTRWGEIINVVSARRVRQSDWRKEGIPFYRAREIAKLAEFGNVENDLFISEELYNEFSKNGIPKQGDLMVSAVGTLGRTYVVKEADKFYYKDASVLCFENYGKINPYFLRYLMYSSFMQSQIKSNSGGTTVDTLTMVRMNVYLIPIPPLAEQDRIVERIDSILSVFN